jgi:hypothetical protein
MAADPMKSTQHSRLLFAMLNLVVCFAVLACFSEPICSCGLLGEWLVLAGFHTLSV